MSLQPQITGSSTALGWDDGDVTPVHLRQAADAVDAAIARLQQAQQTPWQSVAADVFRAELYEAIQLLRCLGEGIDGALVELLRAAAQVSGDPRAMRWA